MIPNQTHGVTFLRIILIAEYELHLKNSTKMEIKKLATHHLAKKSIEPRQKLHKLNSSIYEEVEHACRNFFLCIKKLKHYAWVNSGTHALSRAKRLVLDLVDEY